MDFGCVKDGYCSDMTLSLIHIFHVRILEARIAQPVAEGVAHRHARRGVIAVADVEALAVEGRCV